MAKKGKLNTNLDDDDDIKAISALGDDDDDVDLTNVTEEDLDNEEGGPFQMGTIPHDGDDEDEDVAYLKQAKTLGPAEGTSEFDAEVGISDDVFDSSDEYLDLEYYDPDDSDY